MDAHQQLLQPHALPLPTGVPPGVDEAPRSTRSGRQTRQVQQRIGRGDQTPVLADGFGAPHAVLSDAQGHLTVLINRCRRPPVLLQADDLRRAPVRPVRHPHDRPARPRRLFRAHHEPDLAHSWDAHGQREAPIGGLAHRDRAVCMRGDQRDSFLDRQVGARQLQRPAMGIPQVTAGRS